MAAVREMGSGTTDNKPVGADLWCADGLKVINQSMLVVVGAQCLMALISDVLYLMTKDEFMSYWCLGPCLSQSKTAALR